MSAVAAVLFQNPSEGRPSASSRKRNDAADAEGFRGFGRRREHPEPVSRHNRRAAIRLPLQLEYPPAQRFIATIHSSFTAPLCARCRLFRRRYIHVPGSFNLDPRFDWSVMIGFIFLAAGSLCRVPTETSRALWSPSLPPIRPLAKNKRKVPCSQEISRAEPGRGTRAAYSRRRLFQSCSVLARQYPITRSLSAASSAACRSFGGSKGQSLRSRAEQGAILRHTARVATNCPTWGRHAHDWRTPSRTSR